MDRYRYPFEVTASTTTSVTIPWWYSQPPIPQPVSYNRTVQVLEGTHTLQEHQELPSGLSIRPDDRIPGLNILRYDDVEGGRDVAWWWREKPDNLWIHLLITRRSEMWDAIEHTYFDARPVGTTRRMFVMRRVVPWTDS